MSRTPKWMKKKLWGVVHLLLDVERMLGDPRPGIADPKVLAPVVASAREIVMNFVRDPKAPEAEDLPPKQHRYRVEKPTGTAVTTPAGPSDKPAKRERIVNEALLARYRLMACAVAGPECLFSARTASGKLLCDAHHIEPKRPGRGGDDTDPNVLPLCGGGHHNYNATHGWHRLGFKEWYRQFHHRLSPANDAKIRANASCARAIAEFETTSPAEGSEA